MAFFVHACLPTTCLPACLCTHRPSTCPSPLKVCDVLKLADGRASEGGPLHHVFDAVVMEMGVLHYFVDLRLLMRAVSALLVPGRGTVLLRDFHPGQ